MNGPILVFTRRPASLPSTSHAHVRLLNKLQRLRDVEPEEANAIEKLVDAVLLDHAARNAGPPE